LDRAPESGSDGKDDAHRGGGTDLGRRGGKLQGPERIVTHPSGKRLTYGELARAAGTLPVPQDVPLKDRKDFTIIGKRMARFDIPRSPSRNSVLLGHDTPGDGHLLHRAMPTVGGSLKSFDASKAKALPV